MLNFKIFLEEISNKALIYKKLLSMEGMEELAILKDYLEDQGIDQRIIDCLNPELTLFGINNCLIALVDKLKPDPKEIDLSNLRMHSIDGTLQDTHHYQNTLSTIYPKWHKFQTVKDSRWEFVDNYTSLAVQINMNGNKFDIVMYYQRHEEYRVMGLDLDKVSKYLPKGFNPDEVFNYLLCYLLIYKINCGDFGEV